MEGSTGCQYPDSSWPSSISSRSLLSGRPLRAGPRWLAMARIVRKLAICDGDNDASLEAIEALVAHDLRRRRQRDIQMCAAETSGIGVCSSAALVQYTSPPTLYPTSALGVRRERRRFPVGARPTRRPLQPEAIGAVMEVTKWLKPSISVSRIGGSESVQAAT